jgi:Ca2+-binding RTX toxin-like protein
MAVVTGTSVADFIHRVGDGLVFGGFNEMTGVTTGGDSITGGLGNDLIFADGGNDTVTGDDGNDTLVGGQGTDRLFGGVGADVFRIQAASDISGLAETINGGSDDDTLDFQWFGVFGAVNLTAATIISVETLLLNGNDVTLTSAQLDGFTGIFAGGFTDRLILSDGGLVDLTGAASFGIDELRGNALANQIILTGMAQGMTVNVLDGDDSVIGSDGQDRIDGGTGLDTLSGGLGNDTLLGGDDADVVTGGSGNDVIYGGAGTDSLDGGAGNDTIRFTLVGEISGLAETISGGADIDALDFQTDFANGSVDVSKAVLSGLETLLLQGTEITIKAAQLDPFTTILGTGFLERVILQSGGTFDLTGAVIAGIDEFRGSNGIDGMNFTDVATALFIDGVGGNDTIRGGQGSDVIEGGNGADVIFGNEGADTIRGEQGADNIDGGIGNDVIQFAGVSDISGLAETINGGNDVDTLDFVTLGATGRVNLTLATLSNLEILRLTDNVVTLTAAQLGAFEQIQGSGFYERIQISAAGLVDLTNANISGIDEFTGTTGADTFLFAGGTGNLVVNMGGGADSVSGGDSNDTLLGGAGNDTLIGGLGADLLVGGSGTDLLTGGLGADRFDFNDQTEVGKNAARDVITDFTHGQDVIGLRFIDADLNTVGDQAFVFIGAAAFHKVAGELRYSAGVISADTDGDGLPDFQIELTGAPVLASTDIDL